MPLGMHWSQLLILVAVALLIFGPKRLPEMGSAIGKTFKEFQKSMREVTQPEPPQAPVAPPAASPAITPPAQPAMPALTLPAEDATGAGDAVVEAAQD